MGIGLIDSEFNFPMFNYTNLDLFATYFNHKLPLYVFSVLDNQAFAIDAFSMNWNNINTYPFHPIILIPSVLNKIRQSQYNNNSYSTSLASTNMVLRPFELQRSLQRSLIPKWDLSWGLVCLQKAPYEPLHKASKLHVTL